jgi:hypothetical protein
MPQMIDLAGRKFGQLTAIRYSGSRESKVWWLCKCDCGTEKEIRAGSLMAGLSNSCGCLLPRITAKRNLTHGMSYSPEYAIWSSMRDRCRNKQNAHYKYYGGRGISVCERWAENFEAFYQDMGPRPQSLTLDRINNDGNYEPGNCRWATRSQQSANRRKYTLSNEACARRSSRRRTDAQRQEMA